MIDTYIIKLKKKVLFVQHFKTSSPDAGGVYRAKKQNHARGANQVTVAMS